MPADATALALITLLAAFVNGALGYGFSSITLPVALLFYTNRLLNPAMVLVEVAVNGCTLFVSRRSIPQVWRRTSPILVGLLPGILVGSYILFTASPERLKFATFAVLLPLILIQAGGIRRPIRAEGIVGFPFGAGVGLLYSVTTISGPPLAVLLNNQGYVKDEFRAALGLIRLTESVMTAVSYYFLGLYTAKSLDIAGLIIPSIVIGIPLGSQAIRKLEPETFRRVCMSFDAWIVGWGLSKLTRQLHLAGDRASYAVFLAVILIDAWLLYAFFSRRKRAVDALPDGSLAGTAGSR
ncbi:MAG: sulfite exporter TauE/SafE family protein [Elusimicrobia bacterium]|nr:sulfite exporter TauE/SafE family protein [Elusimicrobiota bacterium]